MYLILAETADPGQPVPGAPSQLPAQGSGAGSRLDDLHEDTPGVLGVHEVDPAAGGAPARGVVQQAEAAGAQRPARRVDVGHPEGELLQPRAGAADELRDRRLGVQRGEQLDPGVAVAHGEHRLVDALLLVDLLVHGGDPEGELVEGDPLAWAPRAGGGVTGRRGGRRAPAGGGGGAATPAWWMVVKGSGGSCSCASS